MSKTIERLRTGIITVVATALCVTGLALLGTETAMASPAPVQSSPDNLVTADALPTVQIDGVVWSQAVVGNTVWAGGRFNNARPAGAAAGTNLTPRSNLLAYDITTGQSDHAGPDAQPERPGAVGVRVAGRHPHLRRR